MNNLKIETSRLTLRPFMESDAAAESNNSRQPFVSHFMSNITIIY